MSTCPPLLNVSSLSHVRTTCELKSVPLDLMDVAARRQFFQRINAEAEAVLVLTEGLLVYMYREHVASLSIDLRERPTFRRWLTDIASAAALDVLDAGPIASGPTPDQ